MAQTYDINLIFPNYLFLEIYLRLNSGSEKDNQTHFLIQINSKAKELIRKIRQILLLYLKAYKYFN